MRSSNDKLLSILSISDNDFSMTRISLYTYLLKSSGFDLDFKYSFGTSFRSKELFTYLDELVSEGVLDENYKITDKGITTLCGIVITAKDYDWFLSVLRLLNSMSDDELYYVALTDYLVYNTIERYGIVKAAESKESVRDVLRSLSGDSDEEFESSLKLVRTLRKGGAL